MRFIQREGTTGDITFTGDQARLLKNGQVVVDWTPGGVLQDVPQGDGYVLEVRTGSTVVAENIAIGVMIAALGQSNMQRWFFDPTVVDAAPSTYQMTSAGEWVSVAGAGARHLTSMLATQLGVPVAIVNAAVGGTALTEEADKGIGHWLDTGPGTLYGDALDLLTKAGGSVEFVLWAQGETDASAHVDPALYYEALMEFMARVEADFAAPIIISEIGTHSTTSGDEYYAQIRTVQHQIANALPYVYMGNSTTDLETIEGIHLTSAARAMAADRMAVTILEMLGASLGRISQVGTSAGNYLQGSEGQDEVRGLGGNDFILGAGGNDLLYGGTGGDVIDGGAGFDFVRGELGNDTLTGGADSDILAGGSGSDSLDGGSGNDEIWADAGADSIKGGLGDDIIFGGDGIDVVSYSGMWQNYTLLFSPIGIKVRDNMGTDGSDRLAGVEFISFSNRGFSIDELMALPSLFTEGNDTIDLNGVTVFTYGINSLYFALGGNDTVYLPDNQAAAERAGYDNEANFDAGAGNDFVIGGALRDLILGGTGNDTLNGGGGEDRMDGGAGDDTYYVDITASGERGDLVFEKSNEGSDTVYSSVKHSLKSNIENLWLTGTANIDGTGNNLANLVIGNSGVNTLIGKEGADTIEGHGGNDKIEGGASADMLSGGIGNDAFTFKSAAEIGGGDTGLSSDRVLDFATGDSINLKSIDANKNVTGDQAFSFIGTGAFSGVAGQLRYEYKSASNLTVLQGDSDGNSVADFELHLVGSAVLSAGSFIL